MRKSISHVVSKGLVALVIMQIGQVAFAGTDGVEYRIAWETADNRYHVYMRPTTTPSKDLSMTGQVTIRVPHARGTDKFTVISITPKANISWSLSSEVTSPEEDKTVDYLSFTYTPIDVKAFAFQAGVETEAFNFSTTGSCVSGVELIDNQSDPFNQPPESPSNSAGTNPGNQFANAGWGTTDDNDYLGNYGGAIICSGSVNRAPIANDDSVTAGAETAINIDVLANDTDADGDTLGITAVTNGTNGTVIINGDQVIYTPAKGFSGSDSFTYTVSDGQDTTTARVNVTVNAGSSGGSSCGIVPTAPQADSVYYRVAWDTTDQRYHLYMYPGDQPSPNQLVSGQVTVKVPHSTGRDTFKATDIQSAFTGLSWSNSSVVTAPTEDAVSDYLSFTPTISNAQAIQWREGTEVEVFSFANSGACLGEVNLLNNQTDPFNQPPDDPANSAGTNPGNSLTNLGWGAAGDNNYAGNYGCAAVCASIPKDTDGDGLFDSDEITLGTDPHNPDSDGDTISDGDEVGGSVSSPVDTDGDGIINALDADDDGDGILSYWEGYTKPLSSVDTDGDGTADYLDKDDDNDGIPTSDEGADKNADGKPDDATDTDGDGIPDYLDANTTTPSSGGSVAVPTLTEWAQVLLSLLLGVVAVFRVKVPN